MNITVLYLQTKTNGKNLFKHLNASIKKHDQLRVYQHCCNNHFSRPNFQQTLGFGLIQSVEEKI